MQEIYRPPNSSRKFRSDQSFRHIKTVSVIMDGKFVSVFLLDTEISKFVQADDFNNVHSTAFILTVFRFYFQFDLLVLMQPILVISLNNSQINYLTIFQGV